jgi:hypothetical protein
MQGSPLLLLPVTKHNFHQLVDNASSKVVIVDDS